MSFFRIKAGLALSALAAAVAMGCATRTDLTPAARKPAPGAETIVSSVEGVRFTIKTDAWPGRDDVLAHVTPVRVKIRNDSDEKIRVDYSDFALVAPNGARYAALPPYGVEGAVTEPVLTAGFNPVMEPAFYHDGFFVAPYYAPAYPGLAPYAAARHYHYDPTYFTTYYDYWARIPLPTQAMLDQALPAGVIEPGGYVEGFLYFERTEMGIERVRFRADVVQAENGTRLGEIHIPFSVEREPLA